MMHSANKGDAQMPPVKVLLIGAGSRGTGYSQWIEKNREVAAVVGVAEPRDEFRQPVAAAHGVPAERVFRDWRDAAAAGRMADAVIITTQDAMHVAPAEAFAAQGYAMLLEKPMAPDQAGCERIVAAVEKHNTIFAVCHVLRYTEYTQRLIAMLDTGTIGEVVSIQHLEPVGYWHQAHSFVRGNWRSEKNSSPMLLSKSCHDMDWIRYLMGARCKRVSSFGSLVHFRKANKPAGSADRCVDCSVQDNCPYAATRYYLGQLEKGHTGWPLDVLTRTPTRESVLDALRTGPDGRCVYACDNDVVDQQVVIMEFDGGKTASFTMTAFNEHTARKTCIFGTRGEIYGDGRYIRHFSFMTNQWQQIDTQAPEDSITGGHGGGDCRLMERFIDAVATGDRTRILSGPAETLETHRMVFAAERARNTGTVQEVK
jgi:predicted dehydrogenase